MLSQSGRCLCVWNRVYKATFKHSICCATFVCSCQTVIVTPGTAAISDQSVIISLCILYILCGNGDNELWGTSVVRLVSLAFNVDSWIRLELVSASRVSIESFIGCLNMGTFVL